MKKVDGDHLMSMSRKIDIKLCPSYTKPLKLYVVLLMTIFLAARPLCQVGFPAEWKNRKNSAPTKFVHPTYKSCASHLLKLCA